jgi:hypothetical protein
MEARQNYLFLNPLDRLYKPAENKGLPSSLKKIILTT